MDLFLSTVVAGAGQGAFDALLALGIVLIYRTSGVLNFAQAAIGIASSFLIYSVSQSLSVSLALLLGLGSAAALGAGTYAAISGVRTRHYALTSAVGTLAVAILIEQVVRNAWPSSPGPFPDPFPQESWAVGAISLQPFEVAALATALVCAGGLSLFLRVTKNGTMVRAISESPETARLCGSRVGLVTAGVWAAAGVMAGLAGFFAANLTFDPSFLDPFFLAALIAAVLGGLRNLWGAVIGAVGLEVSRNLFEVYAPQSVTPYTQTFLLLLLIGVLLVVPRRWLAGPSRRLV